MRIGNLTIWCSSLEAAGYGATHHARFMGIVPGFYNQDQSLWVPRSDLLNWLEDLLSHIGAFVQQSSGDDPVFMFKVGKPI